MPCKDSNFEFLIIVKSVLAKAIAKAIIVGNKFLFEGKTDLTCCLAINVPTIQFPAYLLNQTKLTTLKNVKKVI